MSIAAQTGATYTERLARLVAAKAEQTREKADRFGCMNEDDLGLVAPPPDFEWKPTPNHPDGSFYRLDGWADNFADLLAVHPTYVDGDDALAGRWMVFMSRLRPVGWPPEYPCPHLRPLWEMYDIKGGAGGQNHFGPDYRIGLELGWGGLLEKVRRCHGQHGPAKAAFHDAHEKVILGVQTWIRRHLDPIARCRHEQTDPALIANLDEMLAANERVIDQPPRTLREACQWMAWWNMATRIYSRDGAGCQLDEILRPYYEADLAAGRIDDEDAIFLIACLLLNETHYYQVGGVAPDGADLTSHVSFLILEAAHRLGIANNLTVRVHDGQDEEFFLTAVGHLLRDRKGWPRFAGEKGLAEGFMRNGYPVELARQRACVGCHWMSLPGLEYTLNDIVKINTAKVFDVAFWEMVESGIGGHDTGRVAGILPARAAGVSPAISIDELWRRFEAHLRRAVETVAASIDFHLAHQTANHPELMLNLLSHGPIERGLDAAAGGLDYYNMCVDGAALATVADSFAAIDQRIVREGVLTWEELIAALRTDFVGWDERSESHLTPPQKGGTREHRSFQPTSFANGKNPPLPQTNPPLPRGAVGWDEQSESHLATSQEGGTREHRSFQPTSFANGKNPPLPQTNPPLPRGAIDTACRETVDVDAHSPRREAGVGGQRIRAMLLSSQRYGQGGSLGDEWAIRVSRLFTALVKEKRTPGGRIMIPGWFSWSATIGMGAVVGATPDGRRRGAPISHGANPNNGFRPDGAPTAMAKAIADVQPGYGNTCPMQLELSPAFPCDEEGVRRFAALVKTHFDMGGTLMNVNIVDREMLLSAHKDPWAYPDLIVRVTGFTAYFALLSPEFRQLVVDRLVSG